MEQKLKILNENICSDILNIICCYFDWDEISEKQKLSEKFIEKHRDDVNWKVILEFQILSKKFIKKHTNLIS